jgi:hypothetical protein
VRDVRLHVPSLTTSSAAISAFERPRVRVNTLWIGYGGDHWLGVLTAIPLALFLLGASMGARATRSLPRARAWLGVAVCALFVVGAGSVAGDEVDGGILGLALLLAYLGLLVWIVGVSIAMVRRPQGAIAEPAAALT